jgi:hypothetical protein
LTAVNAKDTTGTTAVRRHPPKFREPSNNRILTRGKTQSREAWRGDRINFLTADLIATKSQPTASGALGELEAENKFL